MDACRQVSLGAFFLVSDLQVVSLGTSDLTQRDSFSLVLNVFRDAMLGVRFKEIVFMGRGGVGYPWGMCINGERINCRASLGSCVGKWACVSKKLRRGKAKKWLEPVSLMSFMPIMELMNLVTFTKVMDFTTLMTFMDSDNLVSLSIGSKYSF